MSDPHGDTTDDNSYQPESADIDTGLERSKPWDSLPQDPTQNYIRLLTITPSKNISQIIECHLEVISLQEPLPYQAVSYAWGEEDASEPILIEGHRILVSRSLRAALTRIREHWNNGELLLKGQRLPVWIDKLCIDQENLIEKSSQVLLMGHIYASA